MTDNEKRAHELAVAVMIDQANVNRETAVGAAKFSYNYYQAYISAYREFLASLNAESPDGIR